MSVLLQSAPSRPTRSRRTCHSVPGSSEKFLAKAPSLAADQIFLDLEDSVARGAKADARGEVIRALNENDWASGPQKTIVYRVNGTDTEFYYRDLIDVVEGAGDKIDAVMLPKVQTPGDIEMTSKLLTQIEMSKGWELGRIGIEAQIEDAKGLIAAEALATASPRMETLIFGPGDYSRRHRHPDHADRRRARRLPGRPPELPLLEDRRRGPRRRHPGDRRPVRRVQGRGGPEGAHPARARARPRRQVDDPPGADRRGERDLHAEPGAVRPRRGHARRYEAAADHGDQGAAIYDGEMIDEANRKMAERIAKAGRAAGLTPSPAAAE